MIPGYFHGKIEEKIKPKEINSCLILPLLLVFGRQLEILVTYLCHAGFPRLNASLIVSLALVLAPRAVINCWGLGFPPAPGGGGGGGGGGWWGVGFPPATINLPPPPPPTKFQRKIEEK